MIKAVLFDMDGVLYDSMPNHTSSWIKVMQNHGIYMSDIDAYMNEGRTGDETIDLISKREGRIIGCEERKQMYEEKKAIFSACPQVAPFKESGELLKKVAGSGLKIMLVTGSGQPSLLDALNDDFPNIFTRDNMVTSFDVKHGKPHPEPYLTALCKGGLNASEAVVVENSPLGVEAAVAAGIYTIAVNTGPLPDETLLNAGANRLLPSIAALLHEWDKIIKELPAN